MAGSQQRRKAFWDKQSLKSILRQTVTHCVRWWLGWSDGARLGAISSAAWRQFGAIALLLSAISWRSSFLLCTIKRTNITARSGQACKAGSRRSSRSVASWTSKHGNTCRTARDHLPVLFFRRVRCFSNLANPQVIAFIFCGPPNIINNEWNNRRRARERNTPTFYSCQCTCKV